MLLRIAWRNLWRNKRRSLIVIGSIIVGLTAIILDESLVHGLMRQMIDNQVRTHLSHVQVYGKGFKDNPLIQDTLPDPGRVTALLDTSAGVLQYGRRIILHGLISSASTSSGVAAIGVEPGREARITDIARTVTRGRYFTGSERDIVIGRKLAEKLDVGLGDKVVLMASTAKGDVGSDLFRIAGIYESFSSDMEKTFVYIPLASAGRMADLGQGVSEIVVRMRNEQDAQSLADALRAGLDSRFDVYSYREALPILISQLAMYEQMLYIIYLIVGIAMIFGIINATLMSIFERIREFGVLMAIGMDTRFLLRMIVLESLILGVVGSIAGMGVGLSIYGYFATHGINLATFSDSLASWGIGAVVYPELPFSAIARQMFIVPIVCVVAALYPAYKAVKLQPIQAIYYV